MRALDGLDVEVQPAGGGILADRGIAGVGEGAGLAVAEAGDVVFVAAEGGFGGFLLFGLVAGEFQLVGAELVVDDGPDDFV